MLFNIVVFGTIFYIVYNIFEFKYRVKAFYSTGVYVFEKEYTEIKDVNATFDEYVQYYTYITKLEEVTKFKEQYVKESKRMIEYNEKMLPRFFLIRTVHKQQILDEIQKRKEILRTIDDMKLFNFKLNNKYFSNNPGTTRTNNVTVEKLSYSFNDLVRLYNQAENNKEKMLLIHAGLQEQILVPDFKAYIYSRDNNICKVCNKQFPYGRGLRIRYIKPLSEFGFAEEDNIESVCLDCLQKTE